MNRWKDGFQRTMADGNPFWEAPTKEPLRGQHRGLRSYQFPQPHVSEEAPASTLLPLTLSSHKALLHTCSHPDQDPCNSTMKKQTKAQYLWVLHLVLFPTSGMNKIRTLYFREKRSTRACNQYIISKVGHAKSSLHAPERGLETDTPHKAACVRTEHMDAPQPPSLSRGSQGSKPLRQRQVPGDQKKQPRE